MTRGKWGGSLAALVERRVLYGGCESVMCPRCGAPEGKPCVVPARTPRKAAGSVMKGNHRERVVLVVYGGRI